MRLISSNENKSEWPKRHICDKCGAELEYDEEDTHIGWKGCEYVTCPACDRETMVGECRVQPPTWKATFHHTSVETGAVNIKDTEIQVYVDKVIKNLCSDKWKPGEFCVTSIGNLLVLGNKWKNGVDIYVTEDYWQDSIGCEDYVMVK